MDDFNYLMRVRVGRGGGGGGSCGGSLEVEDEDMVVVPLVPGAEVGKAIP